MLRVSRCIAVRRTLVYAHQPMIVCVRLTVVAVCQLNSSSTAVGIENCETHRAGTCPQSALTLDPEGTSKAALEGTGF